MHRNKRTACKLALHFLLEFHLHVCVHTHTFLAVNMITYTMNLPFLIIANSLARLTEITLLMVSCRSPHSGSGSILKFADSCTHYVFHALYILQGHLRVCVSDIDRPVRLPPIAAETLDRLPLSYRGLYVSFVALPKGVVKSNLAKAMFKPAEKGNTKMPT